MKTMEQQPRLRRYLDRLDRELTKLPRDQARELRAQLAGHLEEAVSPDDSDERVLAVLDDLGDPETLVDEALGGHRPQAWWRRLRVSTWVIAGVLLALVLAGLIVAGNVGTRYAHAAPLVCSCGQMPITPDAAGPLVESRANGESQSTMKQLPGQRQGFAFEIYNPTKVTQTILGLGEKYYNLFGGRDDTVRFVVSRQNPYRDVNGYAYLTYTAVPVSLAPHETRLLRLTNISPCTYGEVAIGSVPLQVRVGWFTRVESIRLGSAYALEGAGPCPAPGSGSK